MLIQGIIFQITFKIMINFETQEFILLSIFDCISIILIFT